VEHSHCGLVAPVRLTDEVLKAPDCWAAGGCIEDEWHDALEYEPAYSGSPTTSASGRCWWQSATPTMRC
jgi:hypothetical protein